MHASGKVQAKSPATTPKKSYHHGNLPDALKNAVRGVLEAGDIDQVGMREVARIVGVSPSAAYRHFDSKGDLLASVAADGFRGLIDALRAAAKESEPMFALGCAYVDFAIANPGVFGLMFGPGYGRKERHTELNRAVAEVFRILARAGALGTDPKTRRSRALAAWSLIHGFSTLALVDFLSAAKARSLMQDAFAEQASEFDQDRWLSR